MMRSSLVFGTAIVRYKVFMVDGNRRVICAAKLDCIDEQAARRRAQLMNGQHDVELWERDRLVAVFRSATNETLGRARNPE